MGPAALLHALSSGVPVDPAGGCNWRFSRGRGVRVL